MKSKVIYLFLILFWLPFNLLSCSGGGNKESAVAKQIAMSTGSVALVLPNKLSSIASQTCNSEDVSGPRVRMRANLTWTGEGNLLPIVIRLLITNDSRVTGDYAGSVASASDQNETLAFMFGLDFDYIPSGKTLYTTTDCFLDFGTLPKPTKELKGAAQLIVPAILSMTGLVRTAAGVETPFVKEIPATITYVAGSAPVN